MESLTGSRKLQQGAATAKQLRLGKATSRPLLIDVCYHHRSDWGAVQGLVESLTGSGRPQQGAVTAKQLQPTMATSNPALSTTNLLHELDASAQEVIAKVAAAQVSTLVGPCHLLARVLPRHMFLSIPTHVVVASYPSEGGERANEVSCRSCRSLQQVSQSSLEPLLRDRQSARSECGIHCL